MILRKSDPTDKNVQQRRLGRLFQHSQLWYFLTREGTRGPFVDRNAASEELVKYVSMMAYLEVERSELLDGVDADDIEILELEAPLFFSSGSL